MSTATDPIRKVAILVSALDQRSADTVLEQMSDQQAALVRNAIMDMENVDPAEQEQVISEFMDGGLSPPSDSSASGVELDISLQSMLQRGPAEMIGSDEDAPFRFVHEAKADTLAAYLRKEHPQVVAIVISHVPANRAAEVIARLPAKMQGDVLTRIARLQDADPNILREVENGLKDGLLERLKQDSQRAAGVSAVQSILEATADIDRSELIGTVAEIDPALAKQLGESTSTPYPQLPQDKQQPPDDWNSRLKLKPPAKPKSPPKSPPESPPESENLEDQSREIPPPEAVEPTWDIRVSFDDFASFDDYALALIFQRAQPHIAFLALAGAPVALVRRIMTQLSPRDARSLRQRIENIGPIRLLDVELAQRNVAQQAIELIQEGRLPLPVKNFSAAA